MNFEVLVSDPLSFLAKVVWKHGYNKLLPGYRGIIILFWLGRYSGVD